MTKHPIPRPLRTLLPALPILPIPALAAVLLSSCATEGVQERADRRNDWLDHVNENAEVRRDARDERYDRRFDRLMD